MNTKQAYIDKIEAKLSEWKAEAERLKAIADKMNADARIAYLERIRELEAEQMKARAKLDELNSAGEGAWDELKVRIDKALDDFGDTAKSVRDRFAA